MKKFLREDLVGLERYAEIRNDFRIEVMEHKKNRRLSIGPNAALYFEDEKTIQYQIQEMLRIEKIFEATGVEGELETYNPLIPDGTNWKATFMLEFDEEEERRKQLSELIDIESNIWLQVKSFDRIVPICNEDIERTNSNKTSSVHFMRFELTTKMVIALKNKACLSAGIDHPRYNYTVEEVAENIRQSLVNDLD